jgi:oligopeptide transport system substrate-binding protein
MVTPRNTPDRAARRQLILYAITVVAGLAVLMFVLSWAASLTRSGVVTGSAVDLENNEINIYLREEPPQLNTMMSADGISSVVLNHVMEGLLRYDENLELAPGLAERWSRDGNTVTFHLRDEARWSNGDPITAHDFEFAWKTAVDPATASRYAFIFYAIENAEAVNNGELPPEAMGVEALDDRTLQVTLEQPIAYFDRLVAFQTFYPIQEAFYRQTNGRYAADADEMLYSGPYRLTSWVHGASMRMERNPHYWNQGRASIDVINVSYMTSDTNTLLNLFRDEQIVMTNIASQMLEQAMLEGWEIHRFMEGTVFYIDLNHQPDRATSNRNLRLALQLAQDSGELVNRVLREPGYLPGESLFPVWLEGVDGYFRDEYPAPTYVRNAERAREHLRLAMEEEGWEEPPRLVMLSGDTPISRTQSEYYQEVYRSVLGIEVVIDEQTFQQRLEKMNAGEFDLVLAGWGPDYNDPLTFADLYASWNQSNYGRFENDELDALVRVAQNSLDQRERMEAFAGIQRILHEEVAHILNYERGYLYVTHPQVCGIVRRVFGGHMDYSYARISENGCRADEQEQAAVNTGTEG